MADEMPSSADRDVVVSKIISATCLFGISVICGIIPFKLAKVFKWVEPLDQTGGNPDKKPSMTVNMLLCFGGGVLLATTFLHLLPDINHTILYLVEQELMPPTTLALGELLMMGGFFLIYLIEEIVHNYLHRYQHKKAKLNEKKVADDAIDHSDAFMRGITVRNSAILKRLSVTAAEAARANDDFEKAEKQPQDHQNHVHGHGHSHILPLPQTDDEDMLVSSLRGLLIVLALSIHELFEGFAVGLEKTSAGVYFMFAAVSAHKYVISFCIGVELMVQRTKPWLAFVYVVIYSVVSAIGIGIGTLLTSGANADTLQVPNVILQGLATGTLLYVIFFEVLSKDRSGLWPYLSVCGGFLLMFGLQYIAGITENQVQAGKGMGHHHHHH